MTCRPYLKFFCTITLWFYSCAIVQAGQVVTTSDREWAKMALAQETQLGTIESSQSIAVLYFHNKTAQKKMDVFQKGLALMLSTDLSKIDNIFVVERVKLQALLDELNVGESGLVDIAAAPRLGKMLKAYYVVGGDIRKGSMQQELAFDSRLIEVPFETTSVLPPTLGSVDELIQMEKNLLFDIVNELNIPISPQQKKELEAPLSYSLAALLALFAGIDYSDKGNYDKAGEMYNRALAEDPGLELAESSLQELKEMGLVSHLGVSSVEPVTNEAVAEDDMSWGTIGAVTLGLAAAGVGIALLASSGSSGGGGGDSVDPVDPGDDTTTPGIPPTVQPSKLTGACLLDTIIFNFSDPMKEQGTATTDWESNGNGTVSSQWETDQMYIVSWSGDSSACGSSPPPSMEISFSPNDFQAIDGTPLTGQTSFTITTE